MAAMAKAEMPKTRFMVVSAPNTGDVEGARGFGVVDEVGRREVDVGRRVGMEFVVAGGVSTIGFYGEEAGRT